MPRKGENIYKRKDNRWEGRYKVFDDLSGKLAAIIAATCLAAKIENIIHELSKDNSPDITGEIRYEEGK